MMRTRKVYKNIKLYRDSLESLLRGFHLNSSKERVFVVRVAPHVFIINLTNYDGVGRIKISFHRTSVADFSCSGENKALAVEIAEAMIKTLEL